MAANTGWIRQFSAPEIAELEAAVEVAQATGKSRGELTAKDFPLPTLATESHRWLRELADGRGFMLLRGLPVEDWGDEKPTLAYLGLGLHMGTLASQNAAGDLLGHVRDTGADPNDPTVRLYRTSAAQGFHTDGADVIGLLCLHTAQSGGESRIVSSITVFNEIMKQRPELVPLLFDPWHFDRQGEQAEGEDPTFAIPLCYWDGSHLRTFYIGWYIREAQQHEQVPRLTAQQEELLDLIDAVADRCALDMDFQPGDIQLLKNASILHGRAAFTDWPEPERKRHLLRLWINAHTDLPDDTNIVQEVPTVAGRASDEELLD
jgi:hypothetical protein